jgi:hypothetical protein
LLAFSVVSNWPFQFAGLAALPASATISDKLTLLSRDCAWNEAIHFTSDGNSQRFLLSGWCAPEPGHCWTAGKKAGIAVRLPAGADIIMTAEVFPFIPRGTGSQHVQLVCMDTVVGEWDIGKSTTIKAKIPASLRPDDGDLRFWWGLPGAKSPASMEMSGDRREIALAFKQITFSQFDGD